MGTWHEPVRPRIRGGVGPTGPGGARPTGRQSTRRDRLACPTFPTPTRIGRLQGSPQPAADPVVSLYFHRDRTTLRIPIEEFIDTGELRDALNGPLYTDHGGTVIVDQFIRHEHLQAGLDAFSARTGLPTLTLSRADAPVPATRRHLPRPAHPRRAQAVEEAYAAEFAYHRYAW
ncbi:hypothetical protein [Streptomyces sp. S-9]|uniref:hypothetical protein n=1 Tax=Streptomyces TaxID=1883 RepID=UPI00193C3555|nr:hypothetical protein [Streptomyces sp. S-9]